MIKGPCATLVLCGRAVLSGLVNKPYMNCKQHENIGTAMAANYYGCPVQRDLEDPLFISLISGLSQDEFLPRGGHLNF